MNKENQYGNSIEVITWRRINNKIKIGDGGTSVVYKAELQPEGRTVAVKEMNRPRFEEDNDDVLHGAGFCREARLMAKLHHPNIVSLHGIVAENESDVNFEEQLIHGRAGIAMDYMPHGDLDSAADDYALLPWESRVAIASQIAQAMDYMHSMGIIHFDLKASNVLLDLSTNRPSCKICDFGLAMEKEDDMGFMHGVGTDGCMAPEVAGFEIGTSTTRTSITEKADVYSFGVLMYQLLTGEKIDYDLASEEEVETVLRFDGRSSTSVPELGAERWRVVMRKCMAWEESKRPSFHEVAAMLQE